MCKKIFFNMVVSNKNMMSSRDCGVVLVLTAICLLVVVCYFIGGI